MNDLHVSLIQTHLYWEDIEKNLEHFSNKINEIKSQPHLILLPEMFSTAFTMNATEMAQTMSGTAVQWMKETAVTTGATIAGSLIIKEGNNHYNRLVAVNPNGEATFYDKRHLFRMADEHHHFSAGDTKTIIEVMGWKINLQVCYDLRFPVWSRNSFQKISDTEAKAAYDVLIYVANWPEARVAAWNALLKARAIENQCYTLGLNRIGTDGSGVKYNGSSQIIDPKGEILARAKNNEEEILHHNLSFEQLDSFRKKFPVGLDAD